MEKTLEEITRKFPVGSRVEYLGKGPNGATAVVTGYEHEKLFTMYYHLVVKGEEINGVFPSGLFEVVPTGKLKMYWIDFGYEGGDLVITTSKRKAMELLRTEYPQQVEEEEIVEGAKVHFMGE